MMASACPTGWFAMGTRKLSHARAGFVVGIVLLASATESNAVRAAVTLQVPSDVSTNLRCNTASGVATWSAPSASSDCGAASLSCGGAHIPSGTPWDNARVMNGGTFPIGLSHFCCSATDGCGGEEEACWDVNVLNQTPLELSIELAPTVSTRPGDELTRCLYFQIYENCVAAPVEFEVEVTFGGLFQLPSHFEGTVMIPAAVHPKCITVRDPKHTLRSCDVLAASDCDAAGVLHASFIGDPFFDGNWLIGGNLDGWNSAERTCEGGANDGLPCSTNFTCPGGLCTLTTRSSIYHVDILDMGVLLAEWMKKYDSNGDTVPDGDTPCGVFAESHADFNGDGLVDALDFSYISMNFFKDSKDCCCPGSVAAEGGDAPTSSPGPLTSVSISVARRAHRDLDRADLNGDGMLDMADLAAFLRGARPGKESTIESEPR